MTTPIENEEIVVEIEETPVAPIKQFSADALKTARKTYLASLGALAWVNEEATSLASVVQDRVETQFTQLRKSAETVSSQMVDRGSELQSDVRTRFDAKFDDSRAELNKRTEKVISAVDSRLEGLLTSLNIPTKSSLDAVSKRLNSIGRKVDSARRETEKLATN